MNNEVQLYKHEVSIVNGTKDFYRNEVHPIHDSYEKIKKAYIRSTLNTNRKQEYVINSDYRTHVYKAPYIDVDFDKELNITTYVIIGEEKLFSEKEYLEIIDMFNSEPIKIEESETINYNSTYGVLNIRALRLDTDGIEKIIRTINGYYNVECFEGFIVIPTNNNYNNILEIQFVYLSKMYKLVIYENRDVELFEWGYGVKRREDADYDEDSYYSVEEWIRVKCDNQYRVQNFLDDYEMI